MNNFIYETPTKVYFGRDEDILKIFEMAYDNGL